MEESEKNIKENQEEQKPEESEENNDNEDYQIEQNNSSINAFLSPEGFTMMSIALFFDLLDILWLLLNALKGLGEIPSFISSVVAFGIFGSWVLLSYGTEAVSDTGYQFLEHRKARTQTIKTIGKSAKRGIKRGAKTGIRFLIGAIGELLPLLGSLFFWTWFVYSELKDKSKS